MPSAMRAHSLLLAALATAWLAGCSTLSSRDGPGSSPPADLASVPDAEPRIEPIRAGGPNKPYEVLGRDYSPIAADRPIAERGLASWYGRKFHGRRTANGEVYDMYAMTAAHKTMPLPSYARVRNPANGREIVVRINDRGPFVAGRVIDLSYAAALKLDLLRGVAPVEVERITFDEIRSGAWRRGAPAVAAAAPPPPPPPPVVVPSAEVAAVVLEPAAAPAPTPVRGFWIQLGAFREREGAEGFLRRVGAEVEALAPLLAVFGEAGLWRLQAGPYASRDEARAGAERVREALQLVPVVVERR